MTRSEMGSASHDQITAQKIHISTLRAELHDLQRLPTQRRNLLARIEIAEAKLSFLLPQPDPERRNKIPTANDFIDDLVRLRSETPVTTEETIQNERERRMIVSHFLTDEGQKDLEELREKRPEIEDTTLFRSPLPPEIVAQQMMTLETQPDPARKRVMQRELALSGDPTAIINFFGDMRRPNRENILRRLTLLGYTDEATLNAMDTRIAQKRAEEMIYSASLRRS